MTSRRPKPGHTITARKEERKAAKMFVVAATGARIMPRMLRPDHLRTSASAVGSVTSQSGGRASTEPIGVPSFSLLSSSRPKQASGLFGRDMRILLVGEGDYGFARMLCLSHLSPAGISNLVATSYDSRAQMILKYEQQSSATVEMLKSLSCTVLHSVDAAAIDSHPIILRHAKESFDRIVFNFPHAGGSQLQDVEKNKQLLSSFFRASRDLLQSNPLAPLPLVMVALRNTPFYALWNIEQLAKVEGLSLHKKVPFDTQLFAGYTPQRTAPSTTRATAPDLHDASYWCFSLNAKLLNQRRRLAASGSSYLEHPKISPLDLLGGIDDDSSDEANVEEEFVSHSLPSSSIKPSSIAPSPSLSLNNQKRQAPADEDGPKLTRAQRAAAFKKHAPKRPHSHGKGKRSPHVPDKRPRRS